MIITLILVSIISLIFGFLAGKIYQINKNLDKSLDKLQNDIDSRLKHIIDESEK